MCIQDQSAPYERLLAMNGVTVEDIVSIAVSVLLSFHKRPVTANHRKRAAAHLNYNMEVIDMFDFKGQVVLDTGAGSSRGMGRVFARSFAELGAKVVICDINKEGVDANVKELHDEEIDINGGSHMD